MSMRAVAGPCAALALATCVGSSWGAEAASHHWSYAGATGPARWAALEPEFGACAMGHEQSPIDIRQDAVQRADLAPIVFDYHPFPLKIIDNGHTIQVNVAPGSTISVGDHRYELQQFHFHTPSEESIAGQRQDMVAHLVHKDAEGHLAVVAVLFKAGVLNPTLALIWNSLPSHKESEVDVQGVQVDAAGLLPPDHGYYTFAGSLTTPPCSEGVTWFVLRQPSTLSDEEIARFARAYPMNARPLQPLNGRTVRASP